MQRLSFSISRIPSPAHCRLYVTATEISTPYTYDEGCDGNVTGAKDVACNVSTGGINPKQHLSGFRIDPKTFSGAKCLFHPTGMKVLSEANEAFTCGKHLFRIQNANMLKRLTKRR